MSPHRRLPVGALEGDDGDRRDCSRDEANVFSHAERGGGHGTKDGPCDRNDEEPDRSRRRRKQKHAEREDRRRTGHAEGRPRGITMSQHRTEDWVQRERVGDEGNRKETGPVATRSEARSRLTYSPPE